MANVPSVIENQQHRLSDVLNTVLERCGGGPVDIATAYFAISGYRLLRERLHHVGALRLLIGSEPATGSDVGLRPERKEEYLRLLRGDIEVGRTKGVRYLYSRKKVPHTFNFSAQKSTAHL